MQANRCFGQAPSRREVDGFFPLLSDRNDFRRKGVDRLTIGHRRAVFGQARLQPSKPNCLCQAESSRSCVSAFFCM